MGAGCFLSGRANTFCIEVGLYLLETRWMVHHKGNGINLYIVVGLIFVYVSYEF